jgi:hypothetical protein
MRQRTRTGSVLMNSPARSSIPAISGGRPDTVVPKTTSSRPASWPSTSPQAACTAVLSVTPRSRTRATSPAVICSDSSARTTSKRRSAAGPPSVTFVGPWSSSRATRHASAAASRSCSASQPK